MSLTEQGQRRVTAEELLGLAFALGTSMTRLIKADHDDGYIEFPGGVGIHADSAAASAQGFNDGAIGWDGSTPVRNPRRRATYPDGSSGLAWHDWYEPPEPVITR